MIITWWQIWEFNYLVSWKKEKAVRNLILIVLSFHKDGFNFRVKDERFNLKVTGIIGRVFLKVNSEEILWKMGVFESSQIIGKNWCHGRNWNRSERIHSYIINGSIRKYQCTLAGENVRNRKIRVLLWMSFINY